MNKFLKYTFIFIEIFLIGILITYFFYRSRYLNNIDRDSLNSTISDINSSGDLPQNVYSAFNKNYPKSLENNYVSTFIVRRSSLTKIIVYHIIPRVRSGKNGRLENLSFNYFLNRELEHKTLPKQRLNWILQNSDYLNNVRGIEKASQFYYQKDLQNLEGPKLDTLILMVKNPMKYSPG